MSDRSCSCRTWHNQDSCLASNKENFQEIRLKSAKCDKLQVCNQATNNLFAVDASGFDFVLLLGRYFFVYEHTVVQSHWLTHLVQSPARHRKTPTANSHVKFTLLLVSRFLGVPSSCSSTLSLCLRSTTNLIEHTSSFLPPDLFLLLPPIVIREIERAHTAAVLVRDLLTASTLVSSSSALKEETTY